VNIKTRGAMSLQGIISLHATVFFESGDIPQHGYMSDNMGVVLFKPLLQHTKGNDLKMGPDTQVNTDTDRCGYISYQEIF
jgi:hypothetical protein